MAYGIEFNNDSGNFLIQDKAPSYMFIGKATYVSVAPFNTVPSRKYTREWYLWHGNPYTRTSEGAVSGTGSFTLFLDGCNTYSRIATIRDDSGVGKFFIYAYNRPLIFSVNSCVASVTDTGVTNSEGEIKWDISIIAFYPVGDAVSTVSSMELYCFASVGGHTPSGQGLATYGSDGKCTFDSNLQPLDIKDTMTITSLVADGTANVDSVDYTYSGGLAVGSLTKPMWATTDWARFYMRYSYQAADHWSKWFLMKTKYACTYYFDTYLGQPWYKVIGVASGFSWDGSSIVSNFNIATRVDWGIRVEALPPVLSQFPPWPEYYMHGQKTTGLPLTVPIIDGEDYD